MASPTRARTKQNPRWPSRSVHRRGHNSQRRRPSGRVRHHRAGWGSADGIARPVGPVTAGGARFGLLPGGHRVDPYGHVLPPVVGGQARLAAQMDQEVDRIGELTPHLGQEGGAVAGGRQDDAVDTGAQPGRKIGFVDGRQGDRRGQDGHLDDGVRQFARGQGREARVADGRCDGVGFDVGAQRLVGLQAADASAQRAAGRSARGQGHEAGSRRPEPARVLGALRSPGECGVLLCREGDRVEMPGDGATGEGQQEQAGVGGQRGRHDGAPPR